MARRTLPWLVTAGAALLTGQCAEPTEGAELLLPWPRDLPDLPEDYPNWSRDEIVWLIDDAADTFGVSRRLMHSIAWAESKYDPDAYNRRSRASGIYQFIPSTWEAARPYPYNGMYARTSVWFPPANIGVAAWVMSQPYPWGPRHWNR